MSETAPSDDTATENESPQSSLSSYIKLIQSSPGEAVTGLIALQSLVASNQIYSSNESLEDLSTSTLPLLTVEHYLAVALLQSPVTSSAYRLRNITNACVLFLEYLRRMECLDCLTADSLADYHRALDGMDTDNDSEEGSRRRNISGGQDREMKIARFRRRKQHKDEVAKLEAMRERRVRLGMVEQDELDGYDDEALMRNYHLATLNHCAEEAIDEVYQSMRELEMLNMAVRMEKERMDVEKHHGKHCDSRHASTNSTGHTPHTKKGPNQPMEVTKITQDPQTGQLIFKKEQVRSQVFRPGWNQPTMSLEQLGDMEVSAAIEREAKQKVSEGEAKLRPRRYEQLEKDGMEDDANAVDASAQVDRDWDDFKDANPRGSGNKMGDRGDRNF